MTEINLTRSLTEIKAAIDKAIQCVDDISFMDSGEMTYLHYGPFVNALEISLIALKHAKEAIQDAEDYKTRSRRRSEQ